MTTHTLPADVARCLGAGSDADGWRDGCDVCLRRLAPPVDQAHVQWIEPPPIIAFWCEYLIEPDSRGHIEPETMDTEGGEA
jgi:hypothetical protein